MQLLRPTAAAVGEVLAMGDQALVQVAARHRDAVGPGVVAEEVAGYARLAAAARDQHRLIEPRPVFQEHLTGRVSRGGRNRGHGDLSMRGLYLQGLAVSRQVL
jgi:hypothetical protein